MMFRKDLYIPCAILGGVWLFHIVYFIWGIKHTASVDPENAHLIQEAISELNRAVTKDRFTPEMRQAVVKLDKTLKDTSSYARNHIDSPQELDFFYYRKTRADRRIGKRCHL